MKTITKSILILASPVLVMLVFPWLAIHLAEDLATTGLWFLAFFAINPVMVVVLSILAGTDLKKLWWTPIFIALIFPLLFGLAINDFVLDLYVYSAIYLLLGALAMGATYLVKRLIAKQKREEQTQ